MNEVPATQEQRSRSFGKFLETLAGVDQQLINTPECRRQDRIKYRAIGASMLGTGILAFISGTFAISSFAPLVFALPLGALWAGTIVNMDRFLIATSRSTERKKVFPIIVRLSVAVGSSVVIAEPLLHYIFAPEISQEIVQMQSEKRQTFEADILAGGTLQELREEEDQVQKEIDRLEKTRERQVASAIGEAEGSAGSGLAGKGGLYAEKSAEVERTTVQIEEKQFRLEDIREQIASAQGEAFAEVDRFEAHDPDSLLNQIHALHRLKSKDPAINTAVTLISLLLVAVEVTPVVAKLTMKPGVYESALEKEETTATRHFQLASQLETERQNVDFEGHKRNIEGARNSYYQTVHETTIGVFQAVTSSEEFKEAQREIAVKTLGMFQFHMEELISDAIKAPVNQVTELVKTAQDQMLGDIPFRVRSQVAQYGIDHANATFSQKTTQSPPPPLPDQEITSSSLFGNFLDDDADDDNTDPWVNHSVNGSVTTHI